MKKTLATIVTLAFMGCSPSYVGCAPPPSQLAKQNVAYQTRGYDDPTSRNGAILAAMPSVEIMRISAEMELNGNKEDIGRACSSTVLSADDEYDYILTAKHCVEVPRAIFTTAGLAVRTSEPRYEIKGITDLEVIAADASTDSALLRTKKNPKLKPLEVLIGDSDKIQPGDAIYSVGFPGMYDKIVTFGIIANTRTRNNDGEFNYNRFLFTADISPGSSGCPLFTIKDGRAYLIGITSAIISGTNGLYVGDRISDIIRNFKKQGIDML